MLHTPGMSGKIAANPAPSRIMWLMELFVESAGVATSITCLPWPRSPGDGRRSQRRESRRCPYPPAASGVVDRFRSSP